MKLFRLSARENSERSRAIWARFEILYTAVDFAAALCFILGSWFFFYSDLREPATWLFLIGSILFAAKPTLRLLREIKLYRMGDLDDLARRAE